MEFHYHFPHLRRKKTEKFMAAHNVLHNCMCVCIIFFLKESADVF